MSLTIGWKARHDSHAGSKNSTMGTGASFGPNTGEHDFNFKLKHAKNFLKDGAKVKAFVLFRGRTIIFHEKGQILLLKLAQALEEVGVVEHMPKLEGKKMIMIIAPKKK